MAAHPESLLISAVVRSGEYQLLAAEGITRSLFHVHQDEFEWLEEYVARNSSAPSKTALKQQYPDFVVYRVDDTKHWCEEVRKEHKRQSLINLMDTAMNMLDADDEEHALATVEAGLRDIRTSSSGVNPDFSVYDDWESVYGVIQDRVDRVRVSGMAGIPTGFDTLDHITGGIQGGWFGVIAARLGQGKTWTGIRMAWAAALAGHSVTYFSLEQSKFQIATRVHAFASKQYAQQAFNPLDLNRGQGFDLRDYKKFLKDLQANKGNREFYINDTSRGLVTPGTIANVIQNRQPEIVFIDYLTLMGTSGDDWRGTAKLSSEIQSIAQRYNVPIMALSQVNRLGGMGGEPPGAEHLSQADAIGQDADLVLTMAQKSKRVTRMRLAKFRHGPGGDTWHTLFSPGTGEYEEISEQDASDIIEEDSQVD